MHLKIDIKFTKILSQFKPKKIVNLFMTWNYKFLEKINLKFTTQKTFGYIVNIYFKISKKMDKVYSDLKYST